MRIAIVIGHNTKSQGTVRVSDGVTENAWCDMLGEKVRALNPMQVGLFRRAPNSDPNKVGAEIRACYDLVNEWDADVSCELHLNSVTSPGATGTETLFATNAGKAVATKLQPAVVAALGLRDRGLVHRPSGNGAISLLHGKAPAVLLESYFASNPYDCDIGDARIDALAKAILIGLGGVIKDTSEPPSIEDRLASLEKRVLALEAAMYRSRGR